MSALVYDAGMPPPQTEKVKSDFLWVLFPNSDSSPHSDDNGEVGEASLPPRGAVADRKDVRVRRRQQ